MTEEARTVATLDEASARRVVLVQAIEESDARGRLLTDAQRWQIDRELQQAGAAAGPGPIGPLLVQRAGRVLEAVAPQHAAVAALGHRAAWERWLLNGVPVATLLLGLLTDRIADPHRVDLLSQPLLAIVLWNLVAYAFFLGGLVLVRAPARPGRLERLRSWAAGWRERGPDNLPANLTGLFLHRWHGVAAALGRWRLNRMLHLAAAGWAAGVVLSLVARGAVVEYRVGWESTWFDAAQVHAFLSVLLTPAIALLGVAPLSLDEVARLEVSRNSVDEAGRRWVLLYATLLLVVVIVPRLALAALAWWRERVHAASVTLNLDQPYFQRLVAVLTPARVQLTLAAPPGEPRDALLRVLVQERSAPDPASGALLLVATDTGDTLQLAGAGEPDRTAVGLGTAGAGSSSNGWLAAVRRALGAASPASAPGLAGNAVSDVILQVVATAQDLQAGNDLARRGGRPMLFLVRPRGSAPERESFLAQCAATGSAVLSFDDFACCWVQEGALHHAVERLMPASGRPGYARLAAAWDRRNQARFSQAMATVALQLLEAAREVEEVRSAPMSVRNLLPSERQAAEQARKAAAIAVVARLRESAALTLSRLLALHGVDGREAGTLEHQLEEKFVVQGAVNTPQAGMAGAATGAAMGASVDLMVGGLTLGAAAALGALVGGGAAFIAAAWKNKSTGAVATTVQLGDEMLGALTEAALLRYLAVAHHGRHAPGDPAIQPVWKDAVTAAVASHRERLAQLWRDARLPPEAHPEMAADLATVIESAGREVLSRLYPARPPSAPPASAT